ncbi:TetR/AcrR family transcriptional regulator C-terminal domain-containing protein [Actinacidiphila acididurans]|uniref:TetR/AcrR family transcriptional regulator C-terminal domain-containing protein n=1 Tax=Actinacidiphila acididurans TaxID=2784346 RepID=A0ABS2U1M9_9ACTN|nr:TetR/AcrR family transcriptional regulator C-terminal domain-containing protein [Actinacidiphila acididurans]MBM9509503.1 TetR/AcrR family transcriptional regulator C-terminal domain-containing protein [Actinacidiphila acididurans]
MGPSGPNYLRLVETLLALLDEGGFPAGQAAWGIDPLLQHATAGAAEHAGRQQSGDEQGEWDALTRALREAPADTHPHVAALAATLVSGSPRERTAWTTRALLNGIRATALPQAPGRADRPS